MNYRQSSVEYYYHLHAIFQERSYYIFLELLERLHCLPQKLEQAQV